jgi:hypothetical protein
LDASNVGSQIGLGGSQIGRYPTLDANIYILSHAQSCKHILVFTVVSKTSVFCLLR